jgi:hypothetical protein
MGMAAEALEATIPGEPVVRWMGEMVAPPSKTGSERKETEEGKRRERERERESKREQR